MQWPALAIALGLVAACGGETPPPMCADLGIDLVSCAPLYPPTFDNVYAQTITRTCGGKRSACHSATGASDMDLSSIDTAYASLLDGRVTAGDPSCSELTVRVSARGADYEMPKGSHLTEAERCAIGQWIANGAMR